MKKASVKVVGTLAAIIGAGACPAQEVEPLVTDRPDFTESTNTIPEGRAQAEFGYTYARVGDDKEQSFGELLLRVATGPTMELRVGVPSSIRTRGPGGDASGFEDASLGVKIKLAEGSGQFGFKQPATSVILATSLPTGASAYREKNLQPEVKLCFGWDVSRQVGFASNLNYAYLSEDGERFSQFAGSASFAYSITEKTGAYLEYFGFSKVAPDSSDAHYLNGGLTHLVNNDFQLDARAGVGLNGIDNDYFVGIGAAQRW